jgi:signal transduction protein with GAF and PtsI domain
MNTVNMQERLAGIISAFGAESGTIHLLEGDVLVLTASIGIPPPVQQIIARVPVGKGMAGLAAQRNAPVNTCNLQTDTSGTVRPGAKATGLSGAVVVPLRDPTGTVVGTLGIGVQRDYTYSDDEQQRLIAAGTQLMAVRCE